MLLTWLETMVLWHDWTIKYWELTINNICYSFETSSCGRMRPQVLATETCLLSKPWRSMSTSVWTNHFCCLYQWSYRHSSCAFWWSGPILAFRAQVPVISWVSIRSVWVPSQSWEWEFHAIANVQSLFQWFNIYIGRLVWNAMMSY